MQQLIKILPYLLIIFWQPLSATEMHKQPAVSTQAPHTVKAALTPYKLTYKASYNGMPITATRELTVQTDGQYVLKSIAKNWLGHIEETGVFTLNEHDQITNESYRYQRSIFGKKKTEQLTFNHEKKLALYSSKKKDVTIPLETLFHTRFSYQPQLRSDLIAGKNELSYPTIARGKIKDYRFTIIGEEILETSLGNINTVKVKREREDNTRETLLWFAKDWNYLLVKLWQREDNEDYQITLKEGSLEGVALAQ